MARIQDTTDELFKELYEYIDHEFGKNDDKCTTIRSKIYKAEQNVMLELIKREAVEKVLTERVIYYIQFVDRLDELTGLA